MGFWAKNNPKRVKCPYRATATALIKEYDLLRSGAADRLKVVKKHQKPNG